MKLALRKSMPYYVDDQAAFLLHTLLHFAHTATRFVVLDPAVSHARVALFTSSAMFVLNATLLRGRFTIYIRVLLFTVDIEPLFPPPPRPPSRALTTDAHIAGAFNGFGVPPSYHLALSVEGPVEPYYNNR